MPNFKAYDTVYNYNCDKEEQPKITVRPLMFFPLQENQTTGGADK